ncbi:hypothetical protein ACXHXM_02125
MRKNTSWSAADYEREMVKAFREEGVTVISRDGIAYAQIEDEDGADVLTEVNLTRISREMATALS